MGFIDLHVHSTASDGSLSPENLVSYACEKGLYAFALTDHDSVAGIPAALSAARSFPVHVIPGVEISTNLGGKSLHILGYNIPFQDPTFIRSLRIAASYRDERNIKICAQLRAYGIDINYEEFKKSVGCRSVTRQHFARYLISNGYVKDKNEAFQKYLGKNRPCYVPMDSVATGEAINFIRYYGGIPVLAHPKQLELSEAGYFKLFTVLKGSGIMGIETMYSTHTHDEELMFTNMAQSLDLICTGGSDFHGLLKPDVDLGTGLGNLMIPDTVLNQFKKNK